MAKQSQKTKVIQWLKSGKTLTPLEALQNGMGMRLGAIIHTLRHEEGMNIINKNKTGEDRYAEYEYIAEGEEQSTLDLGNTTRFKYPD
tara:strand:+ start:654 stop:917 length:264 start_codon:yes stop_codon:yes gene_type:complete